MFFFQGHSRLSVGVFLSVSETPQRLRQLENVTRVSTDKAVSSNHFLGEPIS